MIEIRVRRGTSSYLSAQNPVLAAGEPCLESDTGRVKYGDGVTPWNLLDYSSGNDVSLGTNNEAVGADAFSAGGSDNLASGSGSATLGGNSNVAGGTNSVVLGGESNEASGAESLVLGGLGNTSSGEGAVTLGGLGNLAEGRNSVAIGVQARAVMDSQVAMSAGMFESPGDAQSSVFHLRAETQDGSPTRMLIDGAPGNLTLAAGSSWSFKVRVAAYDGNANLAGAWILRGGIGRDFINNTSLSGEPNIVYWADGWDEGTGPSVYADDDTDSLEVSVVGPVGRVVRWSATVFTTEVRSGQPLVSDMFIDIDADAQISSLSVVVDGNDMEPAFDPSITDYAVHSNADFYSSSSVGYSVAVNGVPFSVGSAVVNKAIRVRYGVQEYFVRILPYDFPQLGDVQTKTQDYVPGYYLVAYKGVAPYFGVLDSNGVPVWYTHVDVDNAGCDGNGYNFDPYPFSLHAGNEPNRLVTNNSITECRRWDIGIGLNSLTARPLTMVSPDSRGGARIWNEHDTQVLRGPAPRFGNYMGLAYVHNGSDGFYLQERDSQGQVVWEWWSSDYFTTNDSEYFHVNSVDVNPVTGQVLISCRHTSSVFAIDYTTKNIVWVIQGEVCCYGGGSLQSVVKPGITGIHFLTPYAEPTVSGYSQYAGPNCQHDARWHLDFPALVSGNDIVSIFDNQSCPGGRPARGVVYEIDLQNDRAVYRTQVHSTNGSTTCCSSFTMIKESNNLFSGTLCLTDQNPNVMEFMGDSSDNLTQNKTFEMYTWQPPGAGSYRVIKVRSDFLNLNYMRTTAGRIPTVV